MRLLRNLKVQKILSIKIEKNKYLHGPLTESCSIKNDNDLFDYFNIITIILLLHQRHDCL